MADKKKQAEIVSKMTDIISAHLEAIPVSERSVRLAKFEETISRGAKPERNPPKVASTSRSRRKSQRIPA
jgi:hypothetical protein